MQTKKRAKPVKFGKAAAVEKKEKPAEAEPKSTVTVKEIREKVVEVTSNEPVKEQKRHEVTASTPEEEIPDERIEDEEIDEVDEEPPKSLRSREEAEHVLEEAEAILSSSADMDSQRDEEPEEKTEPESELEEDFELEKEPPSRQMPQEDEEEPPVSSRRSRLVTSEDSPFSDDEPPVTTEKKKNLFVYFIVVALVTFFLGLAFIVGGYYALQNKNISFPEFSEILSMGSSTPTPEPTTELVPTNTPKPVDLSAYTIQILNGSGITGEAAKLKTSLIDAGFKVGSTGNADLSDYTKTQISAGKDVDEAYVKKLEEVVGETYVLDSSAPNSGDPQGADVVITIGSDKTE